MCRMSSACFNVCDAEFSISGKPLFHGSRLSFPVGAFTGLIGHNGSGKSTLLKLLGRHHKPTSGMLLLNGKPLESWSSSDFARQVAYVPQQLPAAEGMTVYEIVSLGRYPWHGALGRFKATDRAIVNDALTAAGLNNLSDRYVDSLSGGERQRAWIAMAIAQDTRCLLLDEPTSALDVGHQIEVLTLLRQLSSAKGVTVIAVLHDINMAARYCHHLVALRKGGIIAQGAPHELMQTEVLKGIYGILMGTFLHPSKGHPVSYVQ
ncbi:ATP-binding cassette domain-containing protein [Pantoea dispersa]|nr:ATP-binding cassette domain-containing protein [Pantoea dispersa]UYV59395.1 ATP-binding cassette domain-containing protein [Pantoea dispersa]